ncbi:MAG: hypothetical protein LBR22_07365 [Desulfovibrio sp.]|nr:hypothetical protein [Desulfovibrio sp.]
MLYQLSSGHGPVECEIAVGRLADWLTVQGRGIDVLHRTPGFGRDGAGFGACRSVLVETPEDVALLPGPVKWICASPVRPGHRRKNWFIKVAVVDESAVDAEYADIGLDGRNPGKGRITISTFRCPGKGGQNVNKVETGVRVVDALTGLSAVSVTARIQLGNRKLALERLRAQILEHNEGREKTIAKGRWTTHNELERGNPVAVFQGLDFRPTAGQLLLALA